MFTLGNKEAIVNSAAKFPLTISGTRMTIKGFGTFEQNQLRSCVAQRYIAPRASAISFDAPTATELGVTAANTPVTFSIKIKSTRLSSEWANQYIINSRPLVFEILVSTSETSAQVAAKMQTAFTEWTAKFGMADKGLPFVVTADADITGYLTLTMKEYFLYFQKVITFKVDRIATPINITASNLRLFDDDITIATSTVTCDSTAGLCVGDTVVFATNNYVPTHGSSTTVTTTVASIGGATTFDVASATGIAANDKMYLLHQQSDPTFDGKYLEENARMSLPATSDSYSISPDEKPILTGKYTTLTFEADDATYGGIQANATIGAAKHAFLGTTRGELGGTRRFKFTLYLLEGSDLFTDNEWLEDVLDFIDGAGGFAPTLRVGNKTTSGITADTFRSAATAVVVPNTLA